MNSVLIRFLGMLVSAVGILLHASCTSRQEPPNVLLITLDALRQDHISGLGYERATTPNIDWLIDKGAVLRDVVPTGCSTKVSLTSLLTGLSFGHHRIVGHRQSLPEDHITVAETFKARGYETAGVSATPHISREFNYHQGFDRFEDFRDLETDYVAAEHVAQRLRELLGKRPRRGPFFAWAHFVEPHPPWEHHAPWLEDPKPGPKQFFRQSCTYLPAEEELADMPEVKRLRLIDKYDAAIHAADSYIGLILDDLRRAGELRNTIIAVTTDHGLELLDRFSATHGFNPFDEVVHTFLVLYDGRSTRKLETLETRRQGRIFDVGPTLLGLAGLESPARFDGVDLLSPSAELPRVAFTACYNAIAARTLEYKLVVFDHQSLRANGKQTPVGITDGAFLYDLRNDPGETIDIKEEEPAVFARLKRALNASKAERKIDLDAPTDVEKLSEQTESRLRALGYLE